MALDLDPFDGQDHSRDVVVYRAIVRFTVEQRSVWLNPRFTDADRRRILASPLRLNFKGTWPPTLTSDDARNLHLLAYTRLAAGMNVRNRTAPNMTAAELRQLVCNRRPALDPALDQTDIEQYASYNVTVAVSERGEHVLTIRRSAGKALPGSDENKPHMRLPAVYDDFQILVEADLLEKAAQLAP